MKKRIIAAILSAVMLLGMITTVSGAEDKSVQQTVYDFLTDELDLCPAAAAGIMGNIMIECSFDPGALVTDTNGLYSFGLMMWNGPRYESLKEYCKKNGYESTDPVGQLQYLKWELLNTEKGSYAAMKSIPNTIEGAARAAVLWASEFERCTKTSYGLRIYYALNNYWQKYALGDVSNTPGIYGYYYNVPDNIKYGEALTMYGAVVSYSSPLKSLTVGVYDDSGNLVTGRSVSQSELVGNIGVIDRFIVFNKVPKGSYYYVITSVNDDGDYIVDRRSFTVSDKATSSTLVPESKGGVICPLAASCPGLAFSDMPPATSWMHDPIDKMLSEGLIVGDSATTVNPEGEMTRAMLVKVLHRITEKYSLEIETDKRDGVFNDVPEKQWYAAEVKWAYGAELVEGMGDDLFEPNMPITRAQIATLIYRFAELCGEDVSGRSNIEEYIDASDVQEWASEAVAWVVSEGIMTGSDDLHGNPVLCPEDHATRAEVSAMLSRFIDRFETSESEQ